MAGRHLAARAGEGVGRGLEPLEQPGPDQPGELHLVGLGIPVASVARRRVPRQRESRGVGLGAGGRGLEAVREAVEEPGEHPAARHSWAMSSHWSMALGVELHLAGLAVIGQATGDPLERMVGVAAVGAVGQQVLVLGVGQEEQPEDDSQGLLVGVRQLFLAQLG